MFDVAERAGDANVRFIVAGIFHLVSARVEPLYSLDKLRDCRDDVGCRIGGLRAHRLPYLVATFAAQRAHLRQQRPEAKLQGLCPPVFFFVIAESFRSLVFVAIRPRISASNPSRSPRNFAISSASRAYSADFRTPAAIEAGDGGRSRIAGPIIFSAETF